MNITVAQFWTNNVSYAKYTYEINKNYCEQKNYNYYVETDSKLIRDRIQDRDFTWYKPFLVLDVLEKFDSDYVLFLDADAVFVDFENSIENFIIENKDIVCTRDHGPSVMNAGVILFKNTEWVRMFLREWFKSSSELSGGRNNEKGFYKRGLWHDQTCFGYLYNNLENAKNKIEIIGNEVLNSRVFKNNRIKNFIFHAFSFGSVHNRTIDSAYYQIFNIEPPKGSSLVELGKIYGTDKSTDHNYYSRYYENILSPFRQSCDILEIGPCEKSLKVWENFFEKGNIHNLKTDNSEITIKSERIKVFRINQSDDIQLKDFTKNNFDYDVIVDDGTHKMLDQQIAIQILFDKLKPGGKYIIEDLQTSIESKMPSKSMFGWGDSNKTSMLEMLESIQDKKPNTDYKTDNWLKFITQIDNVEVYDEDKNSILAVVTKKNDLEKIDKIKYTETSEILTNKTEEVKIKREKNNTIVYHIYCVNNYLEIVKKQLKRIKDTGLYDFIDKIEVTCVDPTGVFTGIDEVFSGFEKINLFKTIDNKFEYWGIKKVWDISQEYDGNILYMHAKGVSNQYKKRGEEEVSQIKVESIRQWTEMLEYFCIDEWEKCILDLETHDNCGVNCVNGWWYGNFWWTTNEWARKNHEPYFTQDRWFYEAWLNKDRIPKTKEYFHFTFNPYLTKLPNDYYKKDNWSDGKNVKFISAEYGVLGIQIDEGYSYNEKTTFDVTDIIKDNLIKNEGKEINVRVGNNLKGDPLYGHKKNLIIYFSVDDEIYHFAYNEDIPAKIKL